MEKFNSGLRIRIPRNENLQCSDAKMARMRKKAPHGWKVFRDPDDGLCFYRQTSTTINQYNTPRETMCFGSSCAYLGGSKTRRYRKNSKTQKRRK